MQAQRLKVFPDDKNFVRARSIVERLDRAGYGAYFAGGCVRDMLLGRKPKDYDIAAGAPPDRVQELFENTKAVGKEFGVILVVLEGCSYEVAAFRSETGYSDGRRPDDIRFADITQDARRRDFTINGMYFNPLTGQFIDSVGGEKDLENRLLRTIGNPVERFSEDHLRLIRAIRFAARLEMQIEGKTENAIKSLAHLITRVAPERLCDELRVILTDRAPGRAVRLMDRMGLLTEIFPELGAARGCEQPENYHPEGDVFTHTLLTVEKLGPHPDFEVAMAALLHDVGKPPASRECPKRFPEHERIGADRTRKICRRLRVTKKETDRIAWLVKRHMYFKDAHHMKDSTLRRLFAEDGFEQLCRVAHADAMASWGRTDHIDYVLKKRDELSAEELKPEPLINGHDLLATGCRPGPAIGQILDHVFDLQLERDIATRQEALKEALQYAERIGASRNED